MLRQAPQMAAVRDELERVQSAVQTAVNEVTRLDRATDQLPALDEAQHRIMLASLESRDAPEDSTEVGLMAVQALEQYSMWVKQALAKLEPRRHEVAWWTVARIHQALERGWRQTHTQGRVAGAQSVPSTHRTPKFPHAPSTGPKSAFRQVVCICFAVLRPELEHGKVIEPERQIRTFVRWYKDRNEHGREGVAKSGLLS